MLTMPPQQKRDSIVNSYIEISLDFVNECADQAVCREEGFLRLAARWSSDHRDKVLNAARRRYRSNPPREDKIRCLIKCLKKAPEFAKEHENTIRRREIGQEQSLVNRKALSKLTKNHPKGDLVGSTPTIGYKSPGQIKHWGTRRKRRS